MRSKRLGIFATTCCLFVSVAVATPVHASQGTAKQFTSCDRLLSEYPNGVARNKKAANVAVRDGFARPKVSAALYKTNSGRLDRDKDGVMCEQSSKTASDAASPPTVANLSIQPPNPDISWSAETPLYSYRFQIPQAALPQVAQFQVTGSLNESIDPNARTRACRDNVCTFYEFAKSAPWGSEIVLNVVTVGVNKVTSVPATTSTIIPARPKQTNTWTFIANGSRTAVPNASGGDDWADGNQTRDLELSRRLERWDLIRFSVFASNYDGTASCEILRNGVRVDFETSSGGSAYCSAG